MHRVLTTAVAALLGGAVSTARAEPPTRPRLARELAAALHFSDKLTALVPGLEAQIRAALMRRGDADPDRIDAALRRFRATSAVDVERLADDMATVYARSFTEAELADLLAFYRTPTGQAVVSREADVAGAIASASQRWSRDVADRVASDAAKPADPAHDPQRWRRDYIATPANAAVLQKYVDPMDKPEWTALRTITLAKLIGERCRGSALNASVLGGYLGTTGLDKVSIGDLDLMGAIVTAEFRYFDDDRLKLVCAAAGDLFGETGRLVPGLVSPGTGVPSASGRGYITVTPFTDFGRQRG